MADPVSPSIPRIVEAFQRQHRQRGMARTQTKRNYRKNRVRNLQRSRKRYRRMKNNPMFKRKQKLRRLHPERFRRLLGSVSVQIPFWSHNWGDGVLTGIEGQEVLYCLLADPEEDLRADYEDFLKDVYFLEPQDIETFFALLDDEAGLDVSERVVSDMMSEFDESPIDIEGWD